MGSGDGVVRSENIIGFTTTSRLLYTLFLAGYRLQQKQEGVNWWVFDGYSITQRRISTLMNFSLCMFTSTNKIKQLRTCVTWCVFLNGPLQFSLNHIQLDDLVSEGLDSFTVTRIWLDGTEIVHLSVALPHHPSREAAHEAPPLISVFISDKINYTSIKRIYNKFANLIDHCNFILTPVIGEISHKRCQWWDEEYSVMQPSSLQRRLLDAGHM